MPRELALTRGDASDFIEKLMFGDRLLAPHLLLELLRWSQLGLVSVSIVREGAAAFPPIEPAILFPDERHRENFNRWRQLYLETDGKSEVIVVGIT